MLSFFAISDYIFDGMAKNVALIKESTLKQLLSKGITADASLIPRKDRTFEVLVRYADRSETLQTYDGQVRTFVDPMRAIDWAKRTGLLQLHISIDLKRWVLDKSTA